MPPIANPHAHYEELLKKIGRNLLLFQKAEHLIKRLLAIDSLSLPSGKHQETLENRFGKFDQMTLGHVATLFLDQICPSDPAMAELSAMMDSHPSSANCQCSVHVSIRLIGDPAERKKSLTALIRHRNEFIHQLLPKIDPSSSTSCAAMASEMEDLRQTILPEILRLQQDLKSTRESLNDMLDFIESPLGNVELQLPEIQQSPLIRNLAEIAARSTNPGKWTLLRAATQQVQDLPQSQIKMHHLQFDLKSLSELLQASRLFQLHCAPDDHCGQNTFYRLKPHIPESHHEGYVDE